MKLTRDDNISNDLPEALNDAIKGDYIYQIYLALIGTSLLNSELLQKIEAISMLDEALRNKKMEELLEEIRELVPTSSTQEEETVYL